MGSEREFALSAGTFARSQCPSREVVKLEPSPRLSASPLGTGLCSEALTSWLVIEASHHRPKGLSTGTDPIEDLMGCRRSTDRNHPSRQYLNSAGNHSVTPAMNWGAKLCLKCHCVLTCSNMTGLLHLGPHGDRGKIRCPPCTLPGREE